MLAASIAMERHNTQRQIRELQYERASLSVLAERSQDACKRELKAYYQFFNILAGTDLDPHKVKRERVARRLARYEQLTGFKVDSQEFNQAIDRTIAALNM